MRRPRSAAASAFLLLVLLVAPVFLPLAAAASEGPRPLEVVGPDADGLYLLSYEVVRAAAGEAVLALDVVREDLDGRVTGRRDLGRATFPNGSSVHNVSFAPTEGPGDYQVALVVDGRAGGPLRFRVEDGGAASAAFLFDVADEPTTLTLTSDSVNADGKLKSPGDALVTRAVVEDGNGWADLDGVRYLVHAQAPDGSATLFDAGTVAVDADATQTRVPVEDRFARSPVPAGDYRLTLEAVRRGEAVANASRTFSIREVAPVLLAGSLPNVTPDHASVGSTSVVVGDRNGVGEGQLEARVYRGSTRAESDNVTVRLNGDGPIVPLSSGRALADEGGHGRRAFDLTLSVPARAPPGAYRVSLYVDGSLLGTLPFEIARLPHASNVEANASEEALVVAFELDAPAQVVLLVDDAVAADATLGAGAHELRAAAPGTNRSYGWTLRVHAREDGPAVEEHHGWWNRTNDRVPLVVTAHRVTSRLPATWNLDAPGWDLDGATWNATFFDWNGASTDRLQARFDGPRVRVDGPADLEPGRYQVVVRAELPNGTRGEVRWHFEAGPWMRVALGEVVVSGREAVVPVLNDGGIAIHRFVVEVDGVPSNFTLSWQEDGATQAIPVEGKRGVARGLDVRPGENGTLIVRLPDGPLPAGTVAARVRVLALPGGAG